MSGARFCRSTRLRDRVVLAFREHGLPHLRSISRRRELISRPIEWSGHVFVETVYLCGFAFLAGLVDSVVGGGGLIQLPALLLVLSPTPADSLAPMFGTNKLSSICGTGTAVIQYSRRVRIKWSSILPAGAAAFVFAFLGARVVASLKPEMLKPMVLVLLVIVGIYTYWRKDFGNLHAPQLTAHRERQLGVLVGIGV